MVATKQPNPNRVMPHDQSKIWYPRTISSREFKGHRGYTGIMIGLPDSTYHLEFTEHVDGSPCPTPTNDNLLVFYMPDNKQIQAVQSRLAKMGYSEILPENPYWEEKGVTIEDPDGWRIVLMNTEGI